MTDTVPPEKRSEIMSRIRSTNTKPEMVVRKMLHAAGYRYRLHRKDLPGKPDIVLPKYQAVIFVNGCFWHHHEGCRIAATPKSNAEFWLSKLSKNVERDQKNSERLRSDGWRVLVIWECACRQVHNKQTLLKKMLSFINTSQPNYGEIGANDLGRT